MSQTSPAPPDCGGRFAIQSFLGAGGMGTVYEAYDHQRRAQVALKMMRRVSGPWIYRFKNEFRTFAGIVHPNLVTLHELIEWQDEWLFSMELVRGVDFKSALDKARSSPATTPVAVRAATQAPTDEARTIPAGVAHVSAPLSRVFQVSDAVRQLCDGLDFLHGLGIAHGDVKPSNALVTVDGRVVILDFGISRNWRSATEDETTIFGTPDFMAPELLQRTPPTPASDMYAVGVMLYEVLTEGKPEEGADLAAALREARPEDHDTDTAAARRQIMEALCVRLLDGDPERRPTAAEARAMVASEAPRAQRQAAVQLSRGVDVRPFVGRDTELERVRNALLDRRPDAARIVLVSGESGIGKTELMRRVIDRQLPESCVVISGKCYEREQVPYRALDRLVDSLSSMLLAVPADDLQALAWADLAVLARMFPVLRRVPEIDVICDKARRSDGRDAREQRRAAAATLLRLFELVAGDRRVVLYVEDLHWGDEESGDVLREALLSAPDGDLRVVGCHRPPVERGAFVSRLLSAEAPIAHVEVRLDTLDPTEAMSLARQLLGDEADEEQVKRLAEEAQGNPFLIRELADFGGGMELGGLALRSAVAQHAELLSEQARRVLEVLVVAGRRLDIGLASRAADVGQTFEAAVMLLRSQHLIKAADSRGQQIEPYHDRIREAILQGLSRETLAERHRDLVRGLESTPDPDSAILAFHLEGAGEGQRATELYLQAARAAEASLAPLNAASHYAKAVELTKEDDPQRQVALEAQARNLSAAGRAAQAGPIYMQLADDAPPVEALVLRRSAAEAFVYAGEFEKARAVLRTVLDAGGVREPRTLLGGLWAIARLRLWLRQRGNRFTPVEENEVTPGQLLRVDAYETAAELYAAIDLMRVYWAHSAHVRESLVVGEPRRVARALITEVVTEGIGGEKASRQGLELLRIAEEAIREGDCPLERALIRYAKGIHAILNGRYGDVVATLGELAHAPDLESKGQQIRMVRSVLGYSRWWLGQWRTLVDEYRAWGLDAVERGDEVSACAFRVEQGGQWDAVLADEPERAAEQVARALASRVGRDLTHGRMQSKQTRAWISLYLGRGDEAERALRFRGPERAYLRVQRDQMEVATLHAYAALARGKSGIRAARSWKHRIEREGVSWTEPITRIIDASIAAQQGRDDESVVGLEVATSVCERLGYEMFHAAASWRLGVLRGGEAGKELRARAEQRIADQGAKRPDRIVRTLAPGFGDAVG